MESFFIEIRFDPTGGNGTMSSADQEFLSGCIQLEIKPSGHWTPDTPARLSGHPDTWEPPCPGDLEVYGYECVDAEFVVFNFSKEQQAAIVKQVRRLTSAEIEWLMTEYDVRNAEETVAYNARTRNDYDGSGYDAEPYDMDDPSLDYSNVKY